MNVLTSYIYCIHSHWLIFQIFTITYNITMNIFISINYFPQISSRDSRALYNQKAIKIIMAFVVVVIVLLTVLKNSGIYSLTFHFTQHL